MSRIPALYARRVALAQFLMLTASCGNEIKTSSEVVASSSRADGVGNATREHEKIGDSIEALNLVGGLPAENSVAASTVALLSDSGLCSGTLIGPRHVLTAAHCSSNEKPLRWVVFGQQTATGVRRQVTAIVSNDQGADISLVTFSGDVPSGFRSMPVANQSFSVTLGSDATVAGYGLTSAEVQRSSGTLLQGPLRIAEVLRSRGLIRLSSLASASLCFGDSGGPTLYRGAEGFTLLGVNHGVDSKSCDRNSYAVDVRSHRAWLERVADEELRAALGASGVDMSPETAPATTPVPMPTATPIPPVPTPQPSDTQTVPTALTLFARQVLELTNVERSRAGVAPLAFASALARAAQGHAVDMAAKNYFSHASQDGTSPFTRILRAGYPGRALGENIAMGQRSPEAVMGAWMNSSGHRANILSRQFKELGVGVWRNASGQILWVQNFGQQ